jgi:hypothetical protein
MARRLDDRQTDMATPAPQPGRPTTRDGESAFTRNLKFEVADEEGRALIGSYAISVSLGLAFLGLVLFGPATRTPTLIPVEEEPIAVKFDTAAVPEPTPIPVVAQAGDAERTPAPGPVDRRPGPVGREPGTPRQGRPGSRTETNRAGAIGDAFGTGSGAGSGGLVGDASNILGGVAVNSGSGGTGGGLGGSGGGGRGGKVVLGSGQGGQGSSTPGRGGIGGGSGTGGGGGGGIGGVGGGGGITRATVRVAAPRPINVDPIAGPGRDVGELGTFIRSRESILRICYEEQGLKQNPSLAGNITVAITLTGGGSVSNARVTSRTWSGPGASDAEACILGKIRSWRFPSSTAGEGTYAFPFVFTK